MTVTVEEAEAKLGELIDQLAPGEELVITRGSEPVARLIGAAQPKGQPIFGRGRGKLIVHSEDDDHLQDFADSP